MKPQHQQIFKKSALCLALSSALTLPQYAFSAEVEESVEGIERIQVTASRRASTVQEAPLNITALDGDVMKDQNITQLSDVARWVPGLTVPDQGGRSGSPIIVRGLNTNASGPDSDAGTVATYVGEIPLTVDMKILDVERVEVLIGPQGTLYGAGTLGGAIRYLPNKPILDEVSGSIYGDVSNVAHSDDTGTEAGFVVNVPFIDDTLGMRVAFNYLDEPGYVDYDYLVRESGVSLPDPDWDNSSEVNSNLRSVKDVNSDEATTARAMLRWQPNEKFDSTLSYFYQNQKIGGRSIVHGRSLSADNPLSDVIGDYDSGYRYLEPNELETSLISLEITADLGFAELTSATGYSEQEEKGQRDQTDLLIRIDYSYEEFPAFSSFTREDEEQETFTQEVRLVSTGDSMVSWIVGAYYNNYKAFEESKEFTPGYGEYRVENGFDWGDPDLVFPDAIRADALEYISHDRQDITEQAIFGEINIQATEQLQFTFGARFYEYESIYATDSDLPLYNTMFEGLPPTETNLSLEDIKVEDNGDLFKFNVNYQFSDDVMSYFTVSEGFRLGGSNGVAACDPDDPRLCALPEEFAFQPDTTTNYELGFKSTWLNNQLHFNAAVFLVEWENAQVDSETTYGQLPITVNAADAESKGVEISTRAMLSDSLIAFATYAYTSAELTKDAELLGALAGDRLPGSAENQFSLGMNYATEVFGDIGLDVNYGLTYQSDVYSQIGLRNDGEKLPGYALSNMSAVFSKDEWNVTLYMDNMFDKYAYSSVRRTKEDITTGNGADIQRNYGYYLVKPRTIGVRFEYMFDM